jgi:hypothetical protein
MTVTGLGHHMPARTGLHPIISAGDISPATGKVLAVTSPTIIDGTETLTGMIVTITIASDRNTTITKLC